MNITCTFRVAIALSCAAALAPMVHAATFDIGTIFGAGRDFFTAAKGMDEKEEVLVGRDMAGQILSVAPLVNDRALQTYVNRVGRWVASQSERPNLPWHFGVIETSGINAFAAPGGYILVTRGLYEILDNESQLAGVLGHEIGHVIKRHHVELMQNGNLISGLGKGAQAVASSRGGGTAVAGALIVPNIAEIWAKGLDKNSEYDADRLGVVLAMRAGYSPSGLIEVIQKLQARSASDPSLELLFATHPHPTERLQKIGEAVTPRIASLPEGQEPAITRISASAVRPAAMNSRQAMPAGARALSADQEVPPASSGIPGVPGRGGGSGAGPGIDPGQLLRGIFGR